jgi:hypothetical protein
MRKNFGPDPVRDSAATKAADRASKPSGLFVLAVCLTASLVWSTGCRHPAPAETYVIDEAQKARALAAKDLLFQRLSGRLMEVMMADGPVAAIEVCSREAKEIAAKVGEETGVEIGRTSLRLRNSANQPPEWAKPLLSPNATEPQFVKVDDDHDGALLPIRLQAQCMICHGPKDQISDPVADQLAKLYPDDAATGFNEGDLRGWFWITLPHAKADPSAETR